MQQPPEATLAITPVCPHCPGMMEVLGQLVKKGNISALHIINIAAQNEFAGKNEIRSVPWLRLGPFILQGLHTQQEIQSWIDRYQSDTGIEDYFTELLSNGELDTVARAIKTSPEIIQQLIPLISSDETNINVRLGLGAILEDLAGLAILDILLKDLIQLLSHSNPRVRGDAAHFLSFIHSPDALTALQQRSEETDPEVREIIEESIETLNSD